MADWVPQFIDWMATLSPVWAYLLILAVTYSENLIPPMPGDVIVVFGGYLASLGVLSLPIVVAISTVGATVGFMTMYWIGATLGERVIEKDKFRWVKARHVRRVQLRIDKWGFGIVLLNRFLSGLRAVISITVGIARMNKRMTAICAAISGLVWTATIGYVGYLLGENWETVRQYLRNYGRAVMLLLACLALFQLVRFVLMKRREDAEEAVEEAKNGEQLH